MACVRTAFWLAVLPTILLPTANAGDWPQILGPNRDGVAVGEQLLKSWPETGPETEWTAGVGDGFAGVAVKDNQVIVFHRTPSHEVVQALNAATGKEVWSSSFPCSYQSGMSSDSGPRCVPLIGDGQVFVLGVEGDLRCLDSATGKQVWHRETSKDFSAPEGYFGVGSSPVLFKDRLIVNVGSRDNAAVVAFSTKNGETIWQAFQDTASYSAPVIATINGAAHAIVVTRLHTVSFNPDDGAIRFQFPFGARGPTVNGATPVVMGDHVFVSASYRVGSAWADVSSDKPEVKSLGEDFLATQYATPVAHGDVLFAVDGRQDVGTASLKCISPAQQKTLWTKTGFDYGTLLRVNDELLFLTCGGELIRIAADKTEYREVSRATVLPATPRGYRLPALSNGRLFVRGDRQLKCLRVGEGE